MKPTSPETVLAQLRWRCATKKFDAHRAIPEGVWRVLEETLVLTPSSFGLQPWRFVVVTDPKAKQALVPVSWNQTQVADCSHYVVFAIRRDLGPADVERYVDRIAEVRGVARDSLGAYRQMMLGSLEQAAERGFVNEWSARQAYIALGNFMTSAAMLGIDTCPMEGIEPERYDAILGLSQLGLQTVVACAAGYRAADDKYGAMPKVRFALKDMVLRVAPAG
jgi:nitroreductase